MVFLEVLNITLYIDLDESDTFNDSQEVLYAELLFKRLPRLRQIEYSVVDRDGWPPAVGDSCKVLVKGRGLSRGEQRYLYMGGRFYDISI